MIMICGMHHSLTSVTTEMLQAMGFSLGSSEIQERGDKPWNEGGFDNKEVERINVAILKDAGYDNWLFFKKDGNRMYYEPCDEQAICESSKNHIEDIKRFDKCFDGEFANNPVTSLTIRPWSTFCDNIEGWLVCYRNPWYVAQSLMRREGIPFQIGLELWYEHNIRILNTETRAPKVYINAEAYRDNIVAEFGNVLNKLGKPLASAKIKEATDRIYKRSKDHGQDDYISIPSKISDLHDKITKECFCEYNT